MNKSRLKKIGFRFLLLVCGVLLFVYLPFLHLKKYDEMSLIYRTFIGESSEYQGMIEIWNIDTFESGTMSKTSFLESRAKVFQSKYKGLYFMIRNVTENECFNMIDSGQRPDLFSCSYVVAERVREYVCAFEAQNADIYPNFLQAGKVDGLIYAMPWCAGFYSLISTKEKLEKAGKYSEDVCLADVAFDSGYSYKLGKKEKTSVSLTFGANGKLMPQNAILAYNKNSIVQENGVDANAKNQTQYSAYSKFVINEATILLGSQRDLFRIQNKQKQGKMEDVLVCPLTGYTDMVQFMMLAKNEDGLRKKYAEKFALFLVEEDSQKAVEKMGMFAVKHFPETSYEGIMRDITLGNISDCRLFGVFDKIKEFEQS